MMVKETTIQAKSIKINKKSFPCSDIRKYAKKNFDMNNDGKLSKKELKKAKKIADISVYSQKELECLQKLKYLREIDELRLKKVKSIQSLGKLKKLEKLVVVDYKKKLKKVSLKTFKSLKCFTLDAPIRKIELDKNSRLSNLVLRNTKLEKVTLKHMTKLSHMLIDTGNRKLQDVSFINCKKLSTVKVLSPIRKLELGKDSRIRGIVLGNTHIEGINLSNMRCLEDATILEGNRELKTIIIENCTKLKKLGISGETQLKYLKIQNNNCLKELRLNNLHLNAEIKDISNITQLVLWKCDESLIKFSEIKSLKSLLFVGKDNQCIPKEVLSVSTLENLIVMHDKVTKEVNLDELKNLRWLEWKNGILENIKLTDKSKLQHLILNNNNLSGDWDMSEYTSLNDFNCSDNHISTINLGVREDFYGLSCDNNNLKRLDAYWAGEIQCLSAKGNPNLEAFLSSKWYGDGYHSFDKTAKVYYNPDWHY